MLLVILPFVILIFVFGFLTYKSVSGLVGNVSGTSTAVEEKDVIDSMDYHLRSNATDFQVGLFEELNSLIKDGSDESAIAASVAENFVADFYTWTNKDSSYDIGGMYYVFGKTKNNVYVQARNTFYKYVAYYMNTYGKDDLLEVESIDTENPQKTTFEYEGKTYDAYFVTCRWTYKKCSNFPVERYITKSYFTVVNNNGRFEIADAYGDE